MIARGPGWTVTAAKSACVAADAPADIRDQLPGIVYRIDLTLEAVDAMDAAVHALWSLARSFAKVEHGALDEPASGWFEIAPNVRPHYREPGTPLELLELSWWFDHGRLYEDGAVERLLDVLVVAFADAMPQRYGTSDPPEHRFSLTGRAHFAQFLTERLASTSLVNPIVWYGHEPVFAVFPSIVHEPGWTKVGARTRFRCSRVATVIDAACLAHPGRQASLRHGWRAVSKFLQPFYGDVRTLHGYVASRRGYTYGAPDTEKHPVQSGWWNGVPARTGHAVVIGEPYLTAWPELADVVARVGDLAFLSTADWRSSDDAAELVGGVPERIAMPSAKDAYPSVFPF